MLLSVSDVYAAFKLHLVLRNVHNKPGKYFRFFPGDLEAPMAAHEILGTKGLGSANGREWPPMRFWERMDQKMWHLFAL